MRKGLLICMLLGLLPTVAAAQGPASGASVPARANVVAYDDEDAIIKRAYRDSPYYMEISGPWKQRSTDSSTIYSRQLEVEKVWRQFRVYLNVRAARAVRVLIDDVEVGRAADSRQWNEFLLDSRLRYGRQCTLSIEALRHAPEALLERDDLQPVLNGDPFILFKNDPGIDDFSLVADYDASTAIGTLAIDARLFCGKKKGKYYLEAEVWNPAGRTLDRMGRWVIFDKTSDATIDLSRAWPQVQPWSAESPALYTLVLRLRNEDMEEEEVVGVRFGFRSVETKDGTLLLNGVPVTLKGVTYGLEHTEGHAGRERIRQDLATMKRNNINAVRTARYSPMEPWFYELCDELGLYVVCDANLMPSSTQRHAVATDKDFIPLFERRVENLWGSYKNHTSIIAWSLGDSRDNGVCMQAAYKRLKYIEKHRPVLFAGADFAANTDAVAFKYPKEQALKQTLAKGCDRPLVMLAATDADRFSSLGRLWTLVENHRQLQGGFVDAWPLTSVQLAELKSLYSPFDVKLAKLSGDDAEFIVYNRNDFSDFSDYALEYTIFTNLRPNITAGDLPVGISGGGTDKVKLSLPPVDLQAGEELIVRFDLTRRVRSAQADNTLGTVVFPLRKAPQGMANTAGVADTAMAQLKRTLYFVGHEDWRVDTIGLSRRRPDASTYCIDYMLRYASPDGASMCDVRSTYTVFGSGDVTVDYMVSPSERLRGATLQPAVKVWHIFDSVAWFGLDREVCLDGRRAGVLGTYSAAASGVNRQQVRWCAARTANRGLFLQLPGQTFGFKADGHTLDLLPDNPGSFRLHLRPFSSGTPLALAGMDFPKVEAGILEPPTIAASQSRFTAPLSVTIKSVSRGDIRYTLDGSDPTEASPLYVKPLTLTSTTVVKARVFAKGMPPSFTASRKFNYDYIVATAFSRKPNTPYNVGADTLLFDGDKASVHDLTRGWVGFSGGNVDVNLRLAKQIDVEQVTLRYAHSPQLWAFAPRSVAVSFSADGEHFGTPVEVEIPIDPTAEGDAAPQVVEVAVMVNQPGVVAVRLEPRSIETIPAWHRAKGLNPWLLMDEIEIIEK